jgi:carboxymethylenebutenolidase
MKMPNAFPDVSLLQHRGIRWYIDVDLRQPLAPAGDPVHRAPDTTGLRRRFKDFAPEVLALFDHYVHGAIDRRGFLDGAARFAVGGVTAGMLLDALNPKFAQAQQVKPDEPRLKTEYVEFTTRGGYGKMRGYLARPAKAGGPLPAVMVVHENRGLNPHIEDIARRLALENYLVLAPDALHPLGGYPGDEDSARELFKQLDQGKTREDFISVALANGSAHTKAGNGRLGVVGFCYGGAIANFLATKLPDAERRGTVLRHPAAEAGRAEAIRSPLLIHYADQDDRVNAGATAYDAALVAAGVRLPELRVPGHAARLQQRHHAALRRKGREGWPGSAHSISSRSTCGPEGPGPRPVSRHRHGIRS